jgi:hypothetical protein
MLIRAVFSELVEGVEMTTLKCCRHPEILRESSNAGHELADEAFATADAAIWLERSRAFQIDARCYAASGHTMIQLDYKCRAQAARLPLRRHRRYRSHRLSM